jgi:L-threonylcarbamoyladenylate synthase
MAENRKKNLTKAKRNYSIRAIWLLFRLKTVYGLAGNALDSKAIIKNFFKLKNRPQFDPLIVHVANMAQAKELVESFPAKAEKLALKVFGRAPLTFLFKKRKALFPISFTSGMDTVGVSMSLIIH